MRIRYIQILIFLFLSSFTLTAQSISWEYLENGVVSGSCSSTTDCDNGQICFGLQYVPGVTGTATSYTLGFLGSCTGGDFPGIVASSCSMSDNTNIVNACGSDNLFLLQASGNNGNLSITAGTPVILHQVCIALGAGNSTSIIEETVTGLTVSVDVAGGGAETEDLTFASFTADDSGCNVNLPVTWSYFTVRNAGKTAVLDWGTSLEENHDYFDVEHSTDGSAFSTIGKVSSEVLERNGERQYQFIHESPADNVNFYRIRQVDVDGSSSLSVIRTLTFAAGHEADFQVYPNPVVDDLTLVFSDPEDSYEVEVLTTDGRSIVTGSALFGATKMNIATGELPGGVYIIRVNNSFRRFIKR